MAEVPTIEFGGQKALHLPLPGIPKAYVIRDIDPGNSVADQARELQQRLEAPTPQRVVAQSPSVGEMAVHTLMAS